MGGHVPRYVRQGSPVPSPPTVGSRGCLPPSQRAPGACPVRQSPGEVCSRPSRDQWGLGPSPAPRGGQAHSRSPGPRVTNPDVPRDGLDPAGCATSASIHRPAAIPETVAGRFGHSRTRAPEEGRATADPIAGCTGYRRGNGGREPAGVLREKGMGVVEEHVARSARARPEQAFRPSHYPSSAVLSPGS